MRSHGQATVRGEAGMAMQVHVTWATAGPNQSVIRSQVSASGSMAGERPALPAGAAWRATTTVDGHIHTDLDRSFTPNSEHAREAWNVMREAMLRDDLTSLPATGGAGRDRALQGVMQLDVELVVGAQTPLRWHYDLRDGLPPEQVMQLFRAARSFHAYMRDVPSITLQPATATA